MPTISLNKQRIIKLVGKKIEDKELEYVIPMIGTDLNEINDKEIIVEVFPNRPDMLSEEGFARALRYYLNIDKKLKEYNVLQSNYEAFVENSALILRPCVAGAVVKDVNFDKEAFNSIISLQEKLHITHGRRRRVASIGVHDLSKIEFPITYKSVGRSFSFVPLGWNKIATIQEIISEHEKGKIYGNLLSGDKVPVWIDSKGDVLALPPIINGAITAISEKTKDFFIDVTGTNERVVKEVLNIVVTHLVELGGKVYGLKIGNKIFPELNYRKKRVSLEYVNSLLGLNLNLTQIKKLLLRMGLGMEKISDDEFYALIPPYRADILHPIDVVEDLGIAYGYDKFEPSIPDIFTISSLYSFTKFKDKLREILIGMGAQEVLTYHLSNEDVLYKKMMREGRGIKVIHPMNEEYNTLRDSLLPNLLYFLSKNRRYDYPQFIFEIGNIFIPVNERHKEIEMLGFMYANTWSRYDDVKGITETIMRELGVNYNIDSVNLPFYVPGRCAKIMVGKREIGYFGEIHPQIIRNFDLEVPIIGGEINVEELMEAAIK